MNHFGYANANNVTAKVRIQSNFEYNRYLKIHVNLETRCSDQ